ncbi:site-specific DNA-methyltransferase [Cyanobacterium aponinum UTEX 3222]|uniref:site-specific DNA-methyltransferase n=1 Tax=Cyanobacterium aponinum TaxID=379064 RepID=UPI002B4BA60E|nr:site-specific DNA-methyltransferase [Cyanobacterium aponinum]WRL39127.1 site-specific DNA-methyltransferase [Cyanobacterium aponinum UTEX 3221]WRL40566.1 site-specific DNA-methyltransferase [Cyanobacterium aponinum UTEX 3222]
MEYQSQKKIAELDLSLFKQYHKQIFIDQNLNRKLVSFQANKDLKYYRWYKYKEAFSASLVEYLFNQYNINTGKFLDPFAGSGTALFACSDVGIMADGIELLPIGQKIIEANIIARNFDKNYLINAINQWLNDNKWNQEGEIKNFEILPITAHAYSVENEYKIKRYLYELDKEKDEVKDILLFALLSILESISYTRKDGQYLRWDYRSNRTKGSKIFDKGLILSFDIAITEKLKEIREDIINSHQNNDLFSLLYPPKDSGKINLLKGSCLDILPTIKSNSYTGIITSPPYCNRYDYTRTYALELAILGVQQDKLSQLRQQMLSCTVENKTKELLYFNSEWKRSIEICDNMPLLREILNYLEDKKNQGELNNNGIVRMIRGYFYEMSCVIQECYRILKEDSLMFMVNDNVRYAGISISLDLILSNIAENLGFKVEKILVLPNKKGNSSQQMDTYGKDDLRKCIYIWRK